MFFKKKPNKELQEISKRLDEMERVTHPEKMVVGLFLFDDGYSHQRLIPLKATFGWVGIRRDHTLLIMDILKGSNEERNKTEHLDFVFSHKIYDYEQGTRYIFKQARS